MITSSSNKYSEAHQKDKFVLAGGRENLTCDSRGKVYHTGGVAPKGAPTAKRITGGGALTMDIGYSYAYTYLNKYQDCETPPSPASAYVGGEGEGKLTTIKIDGLTVYVSGDSLEKTDGYYNGHTIACEIVNDEYVNVHSSWQYRTVKSYSYDATTEQGVFTINRAFFNVDPDEGDQQYTVKLDDLAMEEGVVGGKAKGNNKLVLGKDSSQNPSDYRLKVIHITQGKGKGQKRIIMDASLREDGLIEVTLDAPWKEKPKFIDETQVDIYQKREAAEKQKGTKRGENFYKRFYSSEYCISDPLRYNGLAIDANVLSYDDKSRRVRLSGLGHSDGLITGSVISYKDNAGTVNDHVTIVLPGDSSTEQTEAYANKRFRIYEGPGAGIDCLIKGVVRSSATSVTLKLDTYGNLRGKKKGTPNNASKYVIYGGEAISTSADVTQTDTAGESKTYDIHPRIFSFTLDKENAEATLRCVHGGASSHDMAYIRAGELNNAETYSNGRCYIMFKIYFAGKEGRAYYITRPIVSAQVVQPGGDDDGYLEIKVPDIPSLDGEWPSFVVADTTKEKDTDNKGAYFVHQDNLQDGYYTGWVAAFYNTGDTMDKGKKKVSSARVAGYLDATGELILANGVAGIGEGWQCVLYSEYTRCIGSRVKAYNEDSYSPSYTSSSNTRYFLLDYFASNVDDEYKDWTFEFLYGTAKKVKGQNIYKQDKNKKTYSVFAYDGKSKRIDCAGDDNYAKGVRMKPAPAGDEFVTVYDPSSYIFKIFENENEDDADSKTDSSANAGCKMRVSGILATTLSGFDQIRLYRASETTATYRLCATLENKNQSVEDNAAEADLGQELDYAHSAPNTAKYVAERNARFAFAGATAMQAQATAIKGSPAMLESKALSAGYQHPEKGLTYCSGDFVGSLSNADEAIALRISENVRMEIPQPSESKSNSMDFQMIVGDAGNGVYCGTEVAKQNLQTRPDVISWYSDPYWWTEPGEDVKSEAFFNTFTLTTPNLYWTAHMGKVGIKTANYNLNPALNKYVVECDGFVVKDHPLPAKGTVTIYRCHFEDAGVDAENIDIETGLERIPCDLLGSRLYVYKFKTPFMYLPDGTPYYFRRFACEHIRISSVTIYFAFSAANPPLTCVPSGNKPTYEIKDDGTYVADVEYICLDASASANPATYDGCTLRFTDAEGTTRNMVFGTDLTYDGTSKKVSFTNTTVKVRAKMVDLGDEYAAEQTSSSTDSVVRKSYSTTLMFIPMGYQIYGVDWQIWKDANGWHQVDDEHTSPFTPSVSPIGSTGLYILNTTLPLSQGESYTRIVLGGEVRYTSHGSSASYSLYFAGLSKHDRKDEMTASYIIGGLDLQEKWSSTGLTTSSKAFAVIPANETAASSAQVFVKHDDSVPPVPSVPASQIRKLLPGYRILCFSAVYEGDTGVKTLALKDGDLEVQITTAGAGVREKVQLENLYNLNDGYGTKITGIVASQLGFTIFKDLGLYFIDPEAQKLQCFTHEFGCIAPGSIVEGRSGHAWLSNGGRIQLQNFSINSPTTEIGKELKPWFDGDEEIGGLSIDWSRIEAETEATYDNEHGDYIFAFPCTKLVEGTSVQCTAIMVWNENYRQWWRVDDTRSGNSMKCGFRYEGHGAFAGANGIYSFKKNASDTAVNAWKYESRWRDEGADDREKLVKKLHLNNVVDHSRTDEPTATMTYYKDQKETPEPNFLAYDSSSASHTFYTNQAKANVVAGIRGYEWKFVMEGSSYLKLKGIDVELRKKDDLGPDLINSPNQTE